MLVPARLGPSIADGSVTVLFRRWRRCQAVPGHVYRTAAGRLLVAAVDVVDPAKITGADARRAGYADRAAVVSELRGEPEWPVYRLRVTVAEVPDERADLAATDVLDAAAVSAITTRLARFDAASSHGPWTRGALELIEQRPAVRAGDLAASVGREMLPFKVDVRKLKNMGLTLSLEVGYRLSPRGIAYLAAVRTGQGAASSSS